MKKLLHFSLMVLCLILSGLLGCAPTNTPSGESSALSPVTIHTDTLPAFTIDYLTGKFDPATHPDFVVIRPEHADRADRYMRADAYAAFCAMYEAALQDGVRLKIISAARNFDKQKEIWEGKWTGKTLVEGGVNLSHSVPDPVERAFRILRFSSMPGTSRHHWGTDIDLNHLENSWFSKGEGLKIYIWLERHASEYGFCQPYSPKGVNRKDGYEEEKWHWSWMPVSRPLTRLAEEQLKDTHIQGFKGDSTAITIGIVRRYILGIHPSCLHSPD
ncbi:MAG: M15 family metallopeptidase [Saprospiraceae bacterium]|nr:M15 family metallopeptidase [Saprospiraceae bacterium]